MDAALQFVPMLIVGFALSLGLTPVSRQIAMRTGVVDKPAARKLHLDNKPLMGGLAIYVAFALAALLFSPPQHIIELGAVVSGAGLLALVGLLDDRYTLEPLPRLVAMVVATGVTALAGIHIRLFGTPLIDIPLTLFWVMMIINAVNFLDNMDGLAAGLSSIAAGFFLVIALSQGQVLVSMLAAALLGSAIGFLAYNFNPSNTFMGDMGAYTLGFVLAITAIKLNFSTQALHISWMVPVFVLALPLFDINLVVWTRLAEGRSPLEAGKDHTSHRLLSLGLSQRATLFALYGFCILFGGIALLIASLPADAAQTLGAAAFGLIGLCYAVMIWIRLHYQRRPVK